MGVQPSKAEIKQQKQQRTQQWMDCSPAEPQRHACIDALVSPADLSAASTASKEDDPASKVGAAESAECGVIPALDSIAPSASAAASASPAESATPTSAIDDAAASSSAAASLTRSSTFQQLASFRHAEAQRRLSLGGCAAASAASASAAATSSGSSAPRSRRRSGLQPEDRVSAEDVRRWSCSINQAEAAAAHSSSPPLQSATTFHAAAAHAPRSRSHSHSSLILSPSHSSSPPTIVRYGVQSADPVRSMMRHHSASSLSHSLSSSYSSSLRSSHRLHVESQLAHCANCGRMDHGEVLLWLDTEELATAAALSSPASAPVRSAASAVPTAPAAPAVSAPAGLIYCSKDCYWSSRARRGNFDDTAEEEEDRGDHSSAEQRAAMQLRLAAEAEAESDRPLSPSPRVRTIFTSAFDDADAEAESAAVDAATLRKQAESEGASCDGEIPPLPPSSLSLSLIISRPQRHSHSAHTASLAVPNMMRRARS